MPSTDKRCPNTSYNNFSWGFYNVLRWSSFTTDMLRRAEKTILSFLKTPYKGFYIDIGSTVGESDKVWTVAINETGPLSTGTPLVLLHGLGSGVALWVLNLDAFARDRPVYAIDILGKSSSFKPKHNLIVELHRFR